MTNSNRGLELERLLDLAEEFKEDTLSKHHEELEEALRIWGVVVSWSSDIVFVNYGGVCPVTNLLGEAEEDLRSSALCIAFGRYRTAMMCLRSFLELPFCGLYYDTDETRYEQHVASRGRTVSLKTALDHLFGLRDFRGFEARYNLRSEIVQLAGELSGFVHARGRERWETFLGEPVRFKLVFLHGRPACDSSFIEAWLALLKRSFDVVSVALFLRYPDVLLAADRLQTISPHSVDAVQSSLTVDRRAQLKSVLLSQA